MNTIGYSVTTSTLTLLEEGGGVWRPRFGGWRPPDFGKRTKEALVGEVGAREDGDGRVERMDGGQRPGQQPLPDVDVDGADVGRQRRPAADEAADADVEPQRPVGVGQRLADPPRSGRRRRRRDVDAAGHQRRVARLEHLGHQLPAAREKTHF